MSVSSRCRRFFWRETKRVGGGNRLGGRSFDEDGGGTVTGEVGGQIRTAILTTTSHTVLAVALWPQITRRRLQTNKCSHNKHLTKLQREAAFAATALRNLRHTYCR